ncbi:hypothetical protein M0E87_02965 [Corynebacterium sp. CCM 9185]|uniref:Secreted protein n=1 Tax=Corynebacterium marambiense TaxID=2765364 RepID=A0ABS0VSN3_9CORY|nr:hypothetical protein [Corynebacterium marambiense]MBI8999788.1 hypothetical protein [Corynebacterium marambiense]MCK7662628.1 hypothetical protein [Corynebacterium marambiense]MCX7543637.1 hypothetical protein [Corynebacterium marambiense]
MRTFRRAALASATAIALTFGASTVAVANEDSENDQNQISSQIEGKANSSEKKDGDKGSSDLKDKGSQLSSKGNSGLNSSEFGKMLDGDKPVNGRDVFGSEIETDIPAWARVLRLITATTLVTGFFGLVVFPVYNFLKFNNWVR